MGANGEPLDRYSTIGPYPGVTGDLEGLLNWVEQSPTTCDLSSEIVVLEVRDWLSRLSSAARYKLPAACVSTPSPCPLSHIGQFCDPIFNVQQSNAGRQQNMGIGRWSRVELYRERGLAVLVAA